jgi:CRP/FNR family cyclic AMP-dependent transcriptional regulator
MLKTAHADATKLFAASPLLNLLPEGDLTGLASHARRLHFDAGETVFAQGAPGASVYWVVTGRLKLTATSPDGSELLHSMIEPGGYCGEITAVDGGVRGVNAIADRSTDTLSLDRKVLLPAIERHPKAAMKLARLLCVQVRIAGATLENLTFHGAETRIWTRLMFLSEQYGEVDPVSGALHIKHRLSQQSLADSVGLTRVMVNRQLSEWRQQGLIEDGRGFVLVLDPKKLESFVWRRSD